MLRCDEQVVGPPMVIYLSGKNQRGGGASAAVAVDLSTGKRVKILKSCLRRSWLGAREFNSTNWRQMLRLTGLDSGYAGLQETNLRSTVSTHQFHYGHPLTHNPPSITPLLLRFRLTYIMYIYYSHLAVIIRSAVAINPIIGTATPSHHPPEETLCPTRTTTSVHTYNNNLYIIYWYVFLVLHQDRPVDSVARIYGTEPCSRYTYIIYMRFYTTRAPTNYKSGISPEIPQRVTAATSFS